jgi:NADPH-dependent glutamate synthase beta subunit-like oxidoreductase
MPKGLDFTRALAEADRCLLCHDAPCSKECPAETDPATFIRKLRLRNLTGAFRTIKRNNILGGTCGVLCPTSRLCQKACSATGIGRPLDIGAIQRFLVEYGWERGLRVLETGPARREKVAVIGSGPAGLSCAAELARQGFPVTVFESRPEPGGVIRYGVPAYRFDRRFMERELADVRGLGVSFRCGSPVAGKGMAEKLLHDGYSAVYLAPGLWEAVRLKANGRGPKGLYGSVDFLAALREERFETLEGQVRGRAAAVIGGGSVAIDCALSALKLGARDVYLVYRRAYAQMPAEEEERVAAQNAGVQFLLLNQPVDYLESGGTLRGLALRRTRLGEPDATGRRKPVEVPGSEWVLEADVVVEAIGNRVPPGVREVCAGLRVDESGLIQADPDTGKTSIAGLFAGGDIVRGPALVVEAVRDGKKAARAIAESMGR